MINDEIGDSIESDSGKNMLEKFCIAYEALHLFVLKLHLTFRAIFWYKKNVTYTRISTSIPLSNIFLYQKHFSLTQDHKVPFLPSGPSN